MEELKYVKKNDENPFIIDLGDDVKIGDGNISVISGPCAIESYEQMDKIAEVISRNGSKIIRGGAFKPRTSPYSFQGLGEEGLEIIKEVAKKYNLKVVSEIMDTRDIEMVSKYVDIIQIGSRNMQNFSLLREVGRQDKPILLKRGMTATIEEWLSAAEYIAYEGNDKIILCERGIRTFETYTRNTLDLAAVPIIKNLSKLPIIVDPSHGTGRRELVIPMAKAAIAVGADGVMVEIHPCPECSVSDSQQTLDLAEYVKLLEIVRCV